jgi:hypothetical protein
MSNFSAISWREQVKLDEMIMISASLLPTHFIGWFFKVLADWKHFTRARHFLLFLLNRAVYLMKKQQIPIVKSLVWMESAIYRIRWRTLHSWQYISSCQTIYIYIHVQVIICQHIFTSMQKSILVSDFMYTMTVRKQSDKSIIHTIEQVQRSRVLRSNDSL